MWHSLVTWFWGLCGWTRCDDAVAIILTGSDVRFTSSRFMSPWDASTLSRSKINGQDFLKQLRNVWFGGNTSWAKFCCTVLAAGPELKGLDRCAIYCVGTDGAHVFYLRDAHIKYDERRSTVYILGEGFYMFQEKSAGWLPPEIELKIDNQTRAPQPVVSCAGSR